MNSIYVPIMRAKQGEFDAISHLSEVDKAKITPWFDVSMLNDEKKKKLKERGEPPVTTYLNSVANGIANACNRQQVFIDLPHWPTNSQTEQGEHVISHMVEKLTSMGVRVNPVIDYESWEDQVYANAFYKMNLPQGQSFCIRLNMNVDTIEDLLSDPNHIKDHIETIIGRLNINLRQSVVLIDFADISSENKTVPDMIEETTKSIELLRKFNFNKIMMAGCSLPPFISNAIKTQNSTGVVIRKEMVAWQALLQDASNLNLNFADYCVRGPSSFEGGFGNTNGKIRYTIDKNYFVARGYQLSKGLKGAQYYELAEKVINSGHYQGRAFSWADDRIFRCSEKEFKGNASNWIAIDTNHHIRTILVELFEFQQHLTAQHARNIKETA